MTTAHNEHTGASLTTAGKGNSEKYAQGWENIFKPRKAESLTPEMDNLKHSAPLVAMALDFHDSVAVKPTFDEEGWWEAREDAWRDAVMRGSSSK